MLIDEPPVPIFGAFARTRAGAGRLSAESLQPWVQRWLREPREEAWWINRQAGVAFFRPERVLDDAVFAIRGSLLGDAPPPDPPPGRDVPPAADAMTACFYDLLTRDASAVSALRGQFSLAVWDGRRRRLLLARDHLGQRAMFFRTEPDRILFCSELEPLLRAPGVTNELDAEGAFWSLAFGMPPPGRTLARRVDRLPAAHVLAWEPDGAPLIQRYWTPLAADAPREATPEVVEDLRGLLDRAIAMRLFHGERAGVLLSGGVDSTYVSATAVAMGAPLQCAFTAEFEERYGMNEGPYASAAAEWLGLPFEAVRVGGAEAADILDTVVLDAAEPAAAWAAITHVQILARARRQGLDALLSGLGADEIFGGYDHFRGFQSRFIRYMRRHPPPPGVDAVEALLLPESQEARRVLYPGVARFFDEAALRHGLHAPFSGWQYASHLRAFYRECRRLKPEAEFMEMMVAHECQHRVPDMLFGNFETISRRMGVEVRYPFLDPDLVRAATGLSTESRYRTRSGRFSLRLRELEPGFKYAMLQVAADRVPAAILNRPRKSFTAPFGGWLSEEVFVERILVPFQRSRFWEVGIVKPSFVKQVVESVGMFPSPALFQLWSLVTLAAWYDRYVD